MLKKILRKFKLVKKHKKNPQGYHSQVGTFTQDEIIAFKNSAWASADMADTYVATVENLRFASIEWPLFKQYITPSSSVLDVGAGTGRLTVKLAELGCSVTAVDISQKMLDRISNNVDGKVTTIATNAENLPFEDNSFDVVTSLSFLLHFPNWEVFLKEQARVCKPGGMLVFQFISGDHLKHFNEDLNEGGRFLTGGDFYSSCTKDDMITFCNKNGLELEALYPHNYFFNVIGSDVLTREEIFTLQSLIRKSCQNETIRNVITRFEREIVSELPPDSTAFWMVALRKKQL